MSDILETILKKMCEISGYDYDNVNWKDNSHLKLTFNTPDGEEEMIEWLTNYMYSLKISELRRITEFPYVFYRRKKQCKKFATNFVCFHGFASFDNNILLMRKIKINNIIDRKTNLNLDY